MARVQCDSCADWYTLPAATLDGLERDRYYLLCPACQQDYDWADTEHEARRRLEALRF